jgi:hypothetical protein
MTRNPFAVLELPADPGLTDDDVRIAWRRIAVATHPDRADGGDPAAFAVAAAAYSDLRTTFSRAEALADLSGQRRTRPPRPSSSRRPGRLSGPGKLSGPGRVRSSGRVSSSPAVPGSGGLLARVLNGRPARIAVRLMLGAAGGTLLVASQGWRPAAIGLLVGAVIVIVRGIWHDLAPRQSGSWQ